MGPGSYYLALGRLVPYKKFDLLIHLANRLSLPLRIVGSGREEYRLKAMAGPTVRFLGFVPDCDLPRLYAGALSVLFPQHEDAGIVPLESLACGTPVIAYAKGGVLDAMEDKVNGLLVSEQSVDAFAAAVRAFDVYSWDRRAIRERARAFSRSVFEQRMRQIVQDAVRAFASER